MKARFLSIASIGIVTGIAGVFLFASNAFAMAGIESVKLTGPTTITIVYSEPVYTSPGDYTNFTGSFAGETVTSITGSGSNTITLNLSGSVSGNASGYLTIGTNVEDVTDNQYFPGSTWNILDSIGPAITYFSMSSNANDGSFAGTNDTISISFNTNEQVTIPSMTIEGHPVSPNGSGTGAFTATYTMQSSDAQQSVPVTITLEGTSNNETSVSFSYNANGTIGTNGAVTNGSAIISSITSNANTPGILTNGNSITFTLTPAAVEPNARISGSYNGVPLTWATTNNGVNYIATYVIQPGQSSETVPLQISGVTLTDQYGNTSAAASGYDIQKTINVTSVPVTLPTVTTTVTATTTTDNSALSAEIQSLETQLTALQSQANSASSGNVSTNNQDGSAGFNFTEFLSVGSQDAQVTALQERLTSDGLYSGPITGFYGTLTQTAVEKFQSAHNIDTYGYVGPSTRAALNAGE